MSLLLNLDKDAQAFILGLSNANLGRNKLTSIALARSLAYKLPILESGYNGENASATFKLEHRIKVEQQLSAINELVVIDIPAVLALAESFYCYSDCVAKGESVVILTNKETAVLDFFKITKFFPNDVIEVISEDPAQLSKMCNSFASILKQLTH